MIDLCQIEAIKVLSLTGIGKDMICCLGADPNFKYKYPGQGPDKGILPYFFVIIIN